METKQFKLNDWVYIPNTDCVGQVIHIFTKQQTPDYPYAVFYTFEGVECESHFHEGEIEKITEQEAMMYKLST